jgi:cytochrome c553
MVHASMTGLAVRTDRAGAPRRSRLDSVPALAAASLRAVRSAALVLLVAATLAAIVWHALLLQTHRHALPRLPGIAASHAQARTLESAVPSEAADACAICHELSASGDYIPPASAEIWRSVAAIDAAARVAQYLAFLAAQSHAWRSRAPPFALHV